jgi:hypothetical protein
VLEGDLTPVCAAALQAVLAALGKKAGPEDVRTAPQRRHDALEEACRRLIGAGCLPDRAGQPTQVQLHLTLDQLRDLPGAADAEAAWRASQSGPAAQPTGSTRAGAAAQSTSGAGRAIRPAGDLPGAADAEAAWRASQSGPAAQPTTGPGGRGHLTQHRRQPGWGGGPGRAGRTGRSGGAAGLADRPGRPGVCLRRGPHPHRHRHRGPGRARCPSRRTPGRSR